MTLNTCQKIQKLINTGITEESHVVYLLVCVRKILEQEGDASQYELLKFYCDWVLHSQLSRQMAQKILSHFNEGHKALFSNEVELPKAVKEISKFNKLIDGMKSFLDDYNIVIPDKSWDYWSRFIFLYASVIEGCPLVVKCKPEIQIKEYDIESVTAEVVIADEISHGQMHYQVSWVMSGTKGVHSALSVFNSFDV